MGTQLSPGTAAALPTAVFFGRKKRPPTTDDVLVSKLSSLVAVTRKGVATKPI